MKSTLIAPALLGLLLLGSCGTTPTPISSVPTPTTPTTPAPSGPTDFSGLKTLSPGKQDTITAKLKVNIVFVGYRTTPPGQVATSRQVDLNDFNQALPKTYNSVARGPSAYGRTEYTGNAFEYQYNYVYADQSFEDDYFAFLKANGAEAPLTLQQNEYNCQAENQNPDTGACEQVSPIINREITGNYQVDASKVENWLADNSSRVGVKNGEYTVYLVNWYDRPDFKFHSYTRLDGGDTDTGTKFGQRGSRRLTAWGGSVRAGGPAQRVWFYDLSANPDPWTSAQLVAGYFSDVDGDGVADYRMPPIWEYGTRKYSIGYGRKVSPDLALVTRYVALNLLFTPSPIYRAALTPPDMPEDVTLDMHVEQGQAAADAAKLLNAQLTQERIQPLMPFASLSRTMKTTPLVGDLSSVYRCFFVDPQTNPDDICAPNYLDYTGEPLFQYAVKETRDEYKAAPAGKYLLPMYFFNDGTNSQGGLLGIAYDDGETGTQSFVYNFLTPDLIDFGYGFTDTAVHETGHHMSLSHPHDGYDAETDTSYGPSGTTAYANLGDESSSVMSYISLDGTFNQFNLDAQYRYLTSAYLNNTNAVLQIIRNSGKESALAGTAASADSLFAQAESAYGSMNYLQAATLAHQGYRQVIDAAKAGGVNVQAYKWYENLNGLAATGKKAAYSATFRSQKGAVIFPEENAYQRKLRLSK